MFDILTVTQIQIQKVLFLFGHNNKHNL